MNYSVVENIIINLLILFFLNLHSIVATFRQSQCQQPVMSGVTQAQRLVAFSLAIMTYNFGISLPNSKSYNFTADVPFFLISIAPNSCAKIKHLKDWEACQEDGHKACLHDLYHSLECLCLFKLTKQILFNVQLIPSGINYQNEQVLDACF